ncbi:MAG: glycosyltransferase [Blastocatellia bacterium]|nr:glycosyltransferase [Blastocatellia bacterium]
MKISVVLPVYNGGQYLEKSVLSVLEQHHPDFEFVIWDDASTDGSLAFLQGLSDPRLRLYQNSSNRGLFPTLNLAIQAAQGDAIRLWSQDDIMKPGCLEQEHMFLEQHPEVGMLYCGRDVIDQDGNITTPFVADTTPEVIDPNVATQIMFYYGSITGNIANVTLRRSVLDEVGLFREDMKVSGDFEMWVRVCERYPIGYVRQSLILLRAHTGQFSQKPGINLVFMQENQEIQQTLLNRLPSGLKSFGHRYLKWIVYTQYAHYCVRCLLAGKTSLARQVFDQLDRFDNGWLALFRWLISGNSRLFRLKPKFMN